MSKSGAVELHLEGLPACMRMLDEDSPQQLQNKMRRGVRAGAKPFQATLKAAASAGPTGHLPRSFAKRITTKEGTRSGGVLAPSVTTRGGESGRDIMASVFPRSPLFNIFEAGARAHEIVPGVRYSTTRTYIRKKTGRRETRRGTFARTNARALSGQAGGSTWPMVHSEPGRDRASAFFSSTTVTHPGMAARPILPTAFAAGVDAAQAAAAAAIFGTGA